MSDSAGENYRRSDANSKESGVESFCLMRIKIRNHRDSDCDGIPLNNFHML
jgi:hypothetical protein